MNLPLDCGSHTCPKLLCTTSYLFSHDPNFPENSSYVLLMHFSSMTQTWQWMLLYQIHHKNHYKLGLCVPPGAFISLSHHYHLSFSLLLFFIALCQGTLSHPHFYCFCRHRIQLSYLCANGEIPNPSSKLKTFTHLFLIHSQLQACLFLGCHAGPF